MVRRPAHTPNHRRDCLKTRPRSLRFDCGASCHPTPLSLGGYTKKLLVCPLSFAHSLFGRVEYNICLCYVVIYVEGGVEYNMYYVTALNMEITCIMLQPMEITFRYLY